MSTSLIIQILLGLLVIILPTAVWFASTRAIRAQSGAAKGAVDAAAYGRAKDIYEGALDQLRTEVSDLRAEIARLRQANEGLASQVQHLSEVNITLRDQISGLREELRVSRSHER